MIEAQRRKRWTEGSCKGFFTIGDEGQLARIDRHGITTETIARWPDRIGRKIDPNRRRFLDWYRRAAIRVGRRDLQAIVRI